VEADLIGEGRAGGCQTRDVASDALPTGTVTFLFTDIEGSTRLVQELGGGYSELLRKHRLLLRRAFTEHNGVEVDTQGDAFFVAFSSAPDAVAAAMDSQAALGVGPIRVRIGIHTGEASVSEEGYVGVDVHRAARICAAAHGGQVLVSASTAPLVDVDLHDLGEHRLKDLFAPIRLYQVGHDDFPPLRTLNFTNLPMQSTPLVGREQETSEVVSLLRDHRLVTLVGAGGTGKTRLAVQAAADASDNFSDGVFWVPLAELRDARMVTPAIAQAVGSPSRLEGRLAGKRMLFVIDNFEQVMSAASGIATMLDGAESVKVLATSREPLRLRAEYEFPVPTLPHGDAVALFTERARAVDPHFDSDPAVDAICRELDGVPLAIELAASRTKVLSTDEILDRLSHRLGLLTASARDAPARQQTLRATIDWSYDLLSPTEGALFARLAVFSGGWTLDAAEAICGADLDTLEGLVAKSLVTRDKRRFGMLEMIREYALERFDTLDERAELEDRHAQYFLAYAEGAEPDVANGDPAAWSRRGLEDRNIRRALDHLTQTRRSELELRLAVAVWLYWFVQASWEECVRRLEHALAEASEPLRQRALGLRALAWIKGRQRDPSEADALVADALQLAEQLGDDKLVGLCLRTQSVLEAWKPGGGDADRKRDLIEEAYRIAERSHDSQGLAALLNNDSIDARWSGDPQRALELSQRSVALTRELHDRRSLCISLPHLADAEQVVGDFGRAKAHLAEALMLCRELDFREKLIEVTNNLAAVCASEGDFGWTAALLGVAERENSFDWKPEMQEVADEYADARRATQEHLGDAEFERAVAAGRVMSLDAVHDYLTQDRQRIAPRVDIDAALALVTGLERLNPESFTIVGKYMRFDATVRASLGDAHQSIVMGLVHPGRKRNAHLIWAAPGSGKTYFVQQVVESLTGVRFAEINLASCNEASLRAFLDGIDMTGAERTLCFVDECDSQPPGFAPYELLLPSLDHAAAVAAPVVFVLAGSSGANGGEMQRRMSERPKGPDLLSRIPHDNVRTIALLDIGDRIVVAVAQFCAAAADAGRRLSTVERMALFYISVDDRLGSPRQLRELCVRAVERLLPGEDRLRYDHLFGPGNPENKAFWMQWQAHHGELANRFVDIEASR
jgi:predicted ATPase/class 3 adenylate cyclase